MPVSVSAKRAPPLRGLIRSSMPSAFLGLDERLARARARAVHRQAQGPHGDRIADLEFLRRLGGGRLPPLPVNLASPGLLPYPAPC